MIRIEPSTGWVNINFKELWLYRELFGFLVWRDIKVKYKQTFLGALWAILVPFFQMVVFTLIFGGLAKLPTDGLPAPLFYYSALLPWTYFATALSMSANSLVGSANLLTKIYFPRIIVPASPCLAGLVDFAIAMSILIVMMVWWQYLPPLTALLLPLLLLIAIGTAFGVGAALAAMNVKYRDIRYTLSFIIQVWMYITVIIPFSTFKETFGAWGYLYGLNPMAGVIEGFRWALLHPYASKSTPEFHDITKGQIDEFVSSGGTVNQEMVNGVLEITAKTTTSQPLEAPWILILIGTATMFVLLFAGLAYFKRMEKMFADIV